MTVKRNYLIALGVALFCLNLFLQVSEAQSAPPKTFECDLAGVSVRLSNFAVVTGEKVYPGDGIPPFLKNTAPLTTDKLLHPNDEIYITFNYESDYDMSDEPDYPSFVAVGIEIPKGVAVRYGPFGIKKKSGKGFVTLNSSPYPGATNDFMEFDQPIRLTVYGKTNAGKSLEIDSEFGVPVKFKKDVKVILTLTQLKELQEHYRRFEELERRVKELESAQKND